MGRPALKAFFARAALGWLCAGLTACDREKEPAPAPPVAALARLVSVSGYVQLERAGKVSPAAPSDMLQRDALETGPDGAAEVRFLKGQRIEVGPNSRFVLGEDRTGLTLEVVRGTVLSRVPLDVPEAPTVTLSILSPFGMTRIGPGDNEVSVEVADGRVRVEVRVGKVEFISKSGKALSAKSGETLVGDERSAALDSKPVLMLQTIQVTVSAAGKSELRKRGQSRWKPVGRRAEPLAPGDAVRVGQGTSSLSLADSRTTLTARRGTELVFEQSTRQGEIEESHLDLKRGALTVNLAADRKSRVLVPGLTMGSETGGQLGVVKTREGFEVAALAGDFRLGEGEAGQPLEAGQLAHVAGSGPARIEDRPRADLALPVKPGLSVYHPGLSQVAFTWDPSTGPVRVDVSADREFQAPILSGLVRRGFVNVEAPVRGALHVRVWGSDGQAELARGSAVFAPERPPKDLGQLRNEVPEGPDKTTIYYQDKPPGVTFTYRAEPNAARYRVAVFRSDALDRPVAERVVARDLAPLEAGVLTEGSYLWSVTPLSAKGEELRGGRMNHLVLVYDNSVPNLAIQSPSNGDPIQSGQVRATGVAPVGSKLFINGRAAELDDKNRFNATATPLGHPPMVVFRLSRPGGADAYTVRTLRPGK